MLLTIMSQRTWNRSLLGASLIAANIAGFSVWLEWNESAELTLKLSLLALAMVLGAAGFGYLLRILRFYFLLSRGGVPISLPGTAFAQAVGSALSVTPGSVGQVFELHLVQTRSGTSFLQTAPLLLVDQAMEWAGLLLLALISAVLIPSLQNRIPAPTLLAASFALLLCIILIWRGRRMIARAVTFALNRYSAGQRALPSLAKLWSGMESGVTPRRLGTALALTCLARIADGLVLLLAAQMLGVSIALPFAMIVIALSGFAGGLSLLPGGAGAAETTMAGLLVFTGAPFASALAITLLTRISTLWLWVGLGLSAAFVVSFFAPNPTLRFH